MPVTLHTTQCRVTGMFQHLVRKFSTTKNSTSSCAKQSLSWAWRPSSTSSGCLLLVLNVLTSARIPSPSSSCGFTPGCFLRRKVVKGRSPFDSNEKSV
ncbi:hypothetical protein DUNSADRAFT_9906 [Dunaliella salina]|uniref:Encoded protein n=1 Tax=Dunaliella salina TaxID=3046 RepID=A0ABQ7GGH8_DUNSA|nr:hypothetical protein DUNSADRAFT_9906 [Dunaliella salina]|eukprot:KAF5833708.1 hypothetical protein DUNSADRAFT_9906 [Dunaliella salina]